MKSAKGILALTLCITLLFGICGCSALKDSYGGYIRGDSDDAVTDAEGDYSGSLDGPVFAPGESEAADSTTGESTKVDGESAPKEDVTVKTPAGLITAGAWNDNENYEAWRALFEQSSDSDDKGKFFGYTGTKSWGFDSYNRLKVTVGLANDADARVAGATVVAKSSDGAVVFEAVTDATGVAYLFTDGEAGSITVSSGEHTATANYTQEASEEISVTLDGSAEKKDIIDIMFVVDVTGSMGDELYFLKNELADVIDKVAQRYSDATINLALLFYRDDGDREKFAYHNFTNVTNQLGLAAIQLSLDKQNANGGGDYPEAVDEALELAVSKQWNTAATTKLIFHVLDAPPHSKTEDMERYKASVEAAASKGIRICPILCSGAEILTEYVVRQAALYTAGTFIFVTDDSGIGNAHHDPQLPNVTIEALNSLLVRIIDGYHSGEFAPPVYYKEDKLINQTQ